MRQEICWVVKEKLPFAVKRITKRYYIIRRSELGAGFFSNYFWVMGHIVFAKEMGYIPVVDMENYPTLYSEEVPINGTSNAWNYYFENADSVSLKEAYQSGRYVLSHFRYLTGYSERYCDETYRFPTPAMIEFYKPVIHRHLRIREDLRQEFEEELASMRKDRRGRWIGVHIRGTDMKNNLGHPMPAAVESYLEKIDNLIKEDDTISDIYLASDEVDIIEKVTDYYKDQQVSIHVQDAFRVRDTAYEKKTGIHEIVPENPRDRHKYLLGLEVLKDAYILSKCEYLVCGFSNITNVAILWNEGRYRGVLLCH